MAENTQQRGNPPSPDDPGFSLLHNYPGDGLTPFVSTLTGKVEDAALKLVGLSDHPQVRCDLEKDPHKNDQWRIIFYIGGFPEGRLVLELFSSSSGAEAWIRGSRFYLAYRRLEDRSDPHGIPSMQGLLRAIGQTVKRHDVPGDVDSPATELSKALEGYMPFLGIKDRMYRQTSGDRSGEVAILRLGFRCNQDCYFCWQDRDWPEPPAEFYKTWMDEFAAKGIIRVSISGGEPTLHPSLPELVDHATHNLRMAVDLQTNAIRMGRKKYLQKLFDAGLRGIFVSYHSANAEVSDAMTRAPKTHIPTVKGIEASLAIGIQVRLNCVVERANHHLLHEHARQIVDQFVTPFPDNPIRQVTYSFPSAYYDMEDFRKNVVPLDQIKPHLSAAVRILLKANVPVTAVGTCGFPLCMLSDDPEALWWVAPNEVDTMDASGRNYGEICNQCTMKSRCLGIRQEYFEAWGERGLLPFTTVPDATKTFKYLINRTPKLRVVRRERVVYLEDPDGNSPEYYDSHMVHFPVICGPITAFNMHHRLDPG